MSIMVLNTKTIEKLGNSILTIKKVTYSNMDLSQYEKTLKGLYNLNIKSWNERYKEDVITEEEKEVFYKINFNNKEKFNNECEVLKALQCLRTNIEIKEKSYNDLRILKELDKYINSLTSYIISNLADYKEANWG